MAAAKAVSQHQEFSVRWNSHLGSFGTFFPQLLAGERFVDVTLVCEGQQIRCHRLVLAACSKFFENIFIENPCKHPVIILPREIKLWEIQALIDFMYKGEVNVTQAGLSHLLTCAESLQIRGLSGSEAALNLNKLNGPTANNIDVMHTLSSTLKNTNDEIKEFATDDNNSTTSSFADVEAAIPCDVLENSKSINISHILESNETFEPKTENNLESFNFHQNNISYNKSENFLSMEESLENCNDNDEESYDEGQMQIDSNNPNSSHYKRIRRSEAILTQAAKCVSKGQTFQTVSNMFNIPVSTIRFFMARKGILPKRKRGRSSAGSFRIINKANLN